MADDLKPMLTKVLASGGEKKFYFAYGVGKRKDGKGDGELSVRGQKPKKADIEGALSDCKQVLEGVCWAGKGANDSETVYFQGKSAKLSGMVVAKMALTARRVAGRQYDFQVPSPEEEARAANLKDGEGDESPAAQAAPATPADGKVEAAPGNLELAYQARVKALTDDLKKALTSGTAAANEAKLRFSESQLLSRKKDYPQAMALLKVVEEQIKLALAGTGADPAAKAAPAADPAAEWKKKYADWLPAIKAAMAAKGPNAAAIAKLLAQATALSKPGGDMAQALAKLTECHALAASATVDGEGKDAAAATKTMGETDSERKYKEQIWKLNVDELGPKIEAAIAAKGPNAAALAKLFTEATALSKPGGDFIQMFAKLKECRALLNGGTADGASKGADSAAKASADGDPAAQWKTKLAQWSPAIKKAIAAKGPKAAEIMKLLAQANALSKPGGDMTQALDKLTECHDLADAARPAAQPDLAAFQTRAAEVRAVIEQLSPDNPRRAELLVEVEEVLATADSMPDEVLRVLGITEQRAKDALVAEAEEAKSEEKESEKAEGEDAPDTEPKTPTARWEAERNKIIPKLLNEIKEVVATKHPKAGKAEHELKVVLRQLKAEMATKQQAAEMERYLKDDDVVAAFCKLTFDLKTPLLKVLTEIKDHLSA